MTTILSTLERSSFVEFVHLFRPEEGRMGVTVTFIAVLELMREGLIDIVQSEAFAPLHVRLSAENRMLRLVANNERPEDIAAAVASGEDVFEPEPAAVVEPVAAAVESDAPAAALEDLDDDDDIVDDEVEIEAGADADRPPSDEGRS